MSSRLQNLPISFFSTVMGLCGMAIALQRAGDIWASSPVLGDFVALLSLFVFVVLLLIYGIKLLRYPEQVVGELSDPVKMSFGATVTVSMVLLSITTLQLAPTLSKALWVTGASLHLVYTLYALNTWIHKTDFEITHISPAWFIPVVGNILVPVAGVVYASPEISWFFFSIGLLFWLVLFTIIIYRMIFHHPLPDKLLPTLFILIAPPAVGFISYVKLSGGLDGFGRVLYFSALFLTLLLFMQLPRFMRLPFYLSWWAYSFPLAAITMATIVMHELTQLPVYAMLAWLFLGILCAIVIYLIVRTLYAISRHQICVAGH
ncbi:MAG TPA: C4-dicarboxylate ABC transporter [Gammaproteobacteria bacterium]|nr:C4-dicarboxylate ABC transporter [Gammaproteobacteria bacterium]